MKLQKIHKKRHYNSTHHRRNQTSSTCLLANRLNLYSSSYFLRLAVQNTEWREILRLASLRKKVQGSASDVCHNDSNRRGGRIVLHYGRPIFTLIIKKVSPHGCVVYPRLYSKTIALLVWGCLLVNSHIKCLPTLSPYSHPMLFFSPSKNQQYLVKIQLNTLEKADQYIDESSPSEDYTERKINCDALERKATFI